ncbi:hypothetical protein HNQ59_000280 [Chitinivorax tropicus]|uniref:YeeE/YedE n=1 Tax=Chitinivorax tropicus TaxID=714531 RepID=A0A840MEB1_9PROT|nr:YeeE/YedE thiosulfate transporter family protein [Chitinivorax tropicus]MBB5017018.1 hypothetical protein [Chitinivorax tropicus]
MTIDWLHFTPWSALAGGLLIGLAAALLLLTLGRVAGISGIVAGLLLPQHGEWPWRLAFVVGLLLSPLAWQLWQPLPPIQLSGNVGQLIVAGLLVGVGTRIGSGCTSGHGICGLSRLSARSLAATLSFIASGILTVALLRHL